MAGKNRYADFPFMQYYCHICQRPVLQIPQIHLLCPLCHSGFLEEDEFNYNGEDPPPDADPNPVEEFPESTPFLDMFRFLSFDDRRPGVPIYGTGETPDACPFCREALEGEEQKELPCRHIFHAACIQPFIDSETGCPVCGHFLPLRYLRRESRPGGAPASDDPAKDRDSDPPAP